SLDAAGMTDRREAFRALAARALVRAERRAAGIRLEFRERDGTVEPTVRTLAEAEKACCPFFDLVVTRNGDVVRLEISAPPDGQTMLDAILELTAHAPVEG